jgi:FkbM family methyltransferase
MTIPLGKGGRRLSDFLCLREVIQVMDVGASCIAETPVYRKLLDAGIGRLTAFDGDPRQVAKIKEAYGELATVHGCFVGDGDTHELYLASPGSGMTSLLRPSPRNLAFFNGFTKFGHVLRRETVETRRLDDLPGIPPVDFLKMDAQGAELMVMQHGTRTLAGCVAVQLEVSFVPLYEGQPCFGEVDVWMRAQGYAPHCFAHLKKWSIAPTIRDGNFRIPFNQLLEADVVYVRHLLEPEKLSDLQLKKLALLADACFGSPDLCIHLLRESVRRGMHEAAATHLYLGHCGKWVL